MACLAHVARASARFGVKAPWLGSQVPVRSFATEAAVQKPKLRLFGISGRYAHALFDTAARAGTLEKVEDDLRLLKQLIHSNPEVQQVVESPTLPPNRRVSLLNVLLQSVGATDVTRRFFNVLVENRRNKWASDIFEKFFRLLSSHRREVSVVVTSAEPLSEKQLDQLRQTIQNVYLAKEDKIKLSTKIDTALLAGFQVQLGERFFDMSLRTELDKIKRTLLETAESYFDRHRDTA